MTGYFCGILQARVLERTPSMSDLNSVVYGQVSMLSLLNFVVSNKQLFIFEAIGLGCW